jgi:hypothetical protein
MPSDFAREKALAVYNKAPTEWDKYAALPIWCPIVEMAHMVKFLAGFEHGQS